MQGMIAQPYNNKSRNTNLQNSTRAIKTVHELTDSHKVLVLAVTLKGGNTIAKNKIILLL